MAELERRLARSHSDSKVMFEYKHTIKGYAIHDEGDVVSYLQTLDSDIDHIEPKYDTLYSSHPIACGIGGRELKLVLLSLTIPAYIYVCLCSQVARASMITPPEEPSLKEDKRQCIIQEEATWVCSLE